MLKKIVSVGALLALIGLCGCKSTYNVDRVTPKNIAREGTVIFVRPPSNVPLNSLRRRAEVMHESVSRNAANFLQVQVGLRNKSGEDLVLSVKTAFYEQPFGAPGTQTSLPVYESNWQTFNVLRGASFEYKIVCPKTSANFYQVTVSEMLN